MDSNAWIARLASSSSSYSRRYQSRSDLYGGGYDETEGDDDLKSEFLCPFCAEEFDVVGLCCHIDEEHPVEAKNGVCPVCAKRVGADIVSHVTLQHGSFFKVQRKRRLRKGGSNLTFSMLRKELREGNFQSLLGGSSHVVSSSIIESDPLLSSFMFNPPSGDECSNGHRLSTEASSNKESSSKVIQNRNLQQSAVLGKDQEEKARRCEFVLGLLASTILGDNV
ncbi:protein DEHYDRATION-INDUCED 19 homolog 4-like isoform X2 [Carica papaya]|uniref:protein DEHYDRATION-INDUCED 19 homolog 4-like isoform X2 n=1 Tax=Carica papaya TaxID=3649 RepID=UPI000B8CE6DE|nr:protein DEHYDRATION-INDUCED 19 homolog 4-like isoform X2 [Carica papaya]